MKLSSFFNNRKKRLTVSVFFVSIIVLVIINQPVAFLFYSLIVFLIILNLIIRKKIAYNADNLFSTIGRNYNYLLIGEMYPYDHLVPAGKSHIEYLSPDKSLYACYELVKRLYSLIDEENGLIFLIIKEKNIKANRITVFDLPFLHDATLKNLGIFHYKYLSFFPLFIDPINTFNYLIRGGSFKNYQLIDAECPLEALNDFCNKRNIRMLFKIIKQ